MTDFSTEILRERFVITPIDSDGDPIIAQSNRAPLKLMNEQGQCIEKLIIRGHMLHSVVRMAGSLQNAFHRTGPLLNRETPLDWDQLWDISAGPHEREYNENLWIAIYHEGKIIYQNGTHHTFLDVIEQCEARNQKSKAYDESLKMAERLFNQAGKPMQIIPESNIAATFTITKEQGRAAVMLRGARKTTTFAFTGEAKNMPNNELNPVHFINVAAAFLEGIQLAFIIGSGHERIRRNLITPYSREGMILSSARMRLSEITATVTTFENFHAVHYRPERPEFSDLTAQAEIMTRKRLDEEDAVFSDLLNPDAGTNPSPTPELNQENDQ